MGRLIIKRSTGSLHGGGLVFSRSPFTKNTRSESFRNLDEIWDLKDGKGIADADVHMIAYYTTPQSCTMRSTSSRSNEEEVTNLDSSDDDGDDDKSMDLSVLSIDKDTNVVGMKRKFPPSFVDSIINQSSKSQIAPHEKILRLDTSTLNCQESNKQLKDMNSEHAVSKIPTTERKNWPQKPCVYCWKNGIRNDTRYICLPCKAALCKEPCFSEYHCTK